MRVHVLVVSVLIWLAGAVSPLRADESSVTEAIAVGVVEEADIVAGTMIIEGYRYRFTPEISVQTGGVASSAALVVPGMQAQVRYSRFPDGSRELLEFRQIPPRVEIERH